MFAKKISFSGDVKMHDGTSQRVYTYTTLLFDFFGLRTKKDALKNIKRKKINTSWDVFEITTNLDDIIYTIKEVKNLISKLESRCVDDEEQVDDTTRTDVTTRTDEDCTIADVVYVKGVGFISDIKMPNGDSKTVTNKFPHKYYISEKKIDVDWEHCFFNSCKKKTTKLKRVSICRHGSRDLGGKLTLSHLPALWSFLCLLEETHDKLQLIEISKMI